MIETLEIDDLDDRQLCPDGTCIGVIGPDGKCKECGRSADPSIAAAARVHGGEGEPLPAAAEDEESSPAPDAEWQERELCPDGNCIGVIGADGACGTCGLRP